MPEMLESIKSALKELFGGGSSSMSYVTLYRKLMNWNQGGYYPSYSDLPEKISLPDDFWKRVEELHRLTVGDNHERAISVFWGDGDLILSSVVRGTESSVQTKGEVSIKYEPTRRTEYYEKIVTIDGKVYSKREVYYKHLPKKIELKYLFNMHTHPVHKVGDGQDFYTFFSKQDWIRCLHQAALLPV